MGNYIIKTQDIKLKPLPRENWRTSGPPILFLLVSVLRYLHDFQFASLTRQQVSDAINVYKVITGVIRQVYVLTVFDTNRKRPSLAASAEKGHKTRASEVSHLFDASFGSPFSVSSVRSDGSLFRIYLPCKIGSRGIIKK